MTDRKKNPLDAALDELRQAVREYEAVLAERQQRGDSLNDQLAAAGDVYTARSALKRAESSLDPNAKSERAAATLSQLFDTPTADDQED